MQLSSKVTTPGVLQCAVHLVQVQKQMCPAQFAALAQHSGPQEHFGSNGCVARRILEPTRGLVVSTGCKTPWQCSVAVCLGARCRQPQINACTVMQDPDCPSDHVLSAKGHPMCSRVLKYPRLECYNVHPSLGQAQKHMCQAAFGALAQHSGPQAHFNSHVCAAHRVLQPKKGPGCEHWVQNPMAVFCC